jgi:hypothetical protein
MIDNSSILMLVIPDKMLYVISEFAPEPKHSYKIYSEQDKTYFIHSVRNETNSADKNSVKAECVFFSRPVYIYPQGWLTEDAGIPEMEMIEKVKDVQFMRKKTNEYEVIFYLDLDFAQFLRNEFPRAHFYHACEFSIPLACTNSLSKQKSVVVNIFYDVMEVILSENGKLVNYLIQPEISTAEDALYYVVNTMRQFHFREEETPIRLCITNFEKENNVITLFKKYLLVEEENSMPSLNFDYFKKFHPVI